MIKLMLLTTNEDLIREAMVSDVDRIFVDLEYINKSERQKGRDTVISHNSIEDVKRIRPLVDKGKLLVRVNPIHANSKYEIDKVIEYGADVVMLPMFKYAEEVRAFIDFVDGRAKTCLLLETAQAMVRIDDILDQSGIDEIYIGLNDLHISLGLDFMFEVLGSGLIEYMVYKIKSKGLPFGFGGLGKIGEGLLPAENILCEHYRLGSSSVILSRTFRNENVNSGIKVDIEKEVKKIREKEKIYSKYSAAEFDENRHIVNEKIKEIVKSLNGK